MRYFKLGMVVVCFVSLYGTKLLADACSVRGTVKSADGNGAGNLVVKVFKGGLSDAQEIGSSAIDSRGNYRITYEAESRVTLIVRVYNQNGSQVASSIPLYNADKRAVINVTVPNPKPTLDVNIKKITKPSIKPPRL